MDTESQKTPDGKSNQGPSARRDKRMKWWINNVEKRMNADGTPAVPVGPSDLDNPDFAGAEDTKKQRENHKREIIEKQRRRKAAAGGNADGEGSSGKTADKKFIVFVGQIPFDTKEEEVKRKFEEIAKPGKINAFRWATHPTSKRFKGYAYVELSNKGAYRRAFELHHSLINGRPINVEATSAGGRKSKLRKDKLNTLSASFQKQAQEAIQRKARDAAKSKKPKPPAIDSDNTVNQESAEPTNAEPVAEQVKPSSGKKTPKKTGDAVQTPKKRSATLSEDSPFVRLPKKPKPDGKPPKHVDSASTNGTEESVKSKTTPVKVKTESGDLKKDVKKEWKSSEKKSFPPRGNFGSMNRRQPEVTNDTPRISGVKPREAHLAGLDRPRLHIKFE